MSVHAPAFPVFAPDFTADEVISQVIYQGQYINDPNFGYCCGDSSTCSLQTGYEYGTRYFSYSTNVSRFDDNFNQVIINDYKHQVQVLVESASNLTCTSWCPMIGAMYPFDLVDTDATWIGETTLNGKQVQHWQYEERGPLNILFQIDNTYLDQSTDPTYAIPVLEFDQLMPLKQDLGQMNESWSNFKIGTPDPSLFAYTNGPLESCPRDPNCGNEQMLRALDSGLRNPIRREAVKTRISELDIEQGARLGNNLNRPRSPVSPTVQKNFGTLPVIPQNFASDTKDFIIIPQGEYDYHDVSGYQYWCLSPQSNGKIQSQFVAGPLFQSADTNETRFGGGLGQPAVVTKYNEGKEYAVDATGTCTSYCPLQSGSALYPLVIDPLAKDLGKVSIAGNAYEQFHWIEYLFPERQWEPMEIIDAFMDLTDPANPKPYIWQETLTPFGQYLATANSTYTNFVGGPQSEDLFMVNGASSCPLDANCGSSSV
jgi:hypothetical protein